MVKNSNRISTDDMTGLEKRIYAALIAKDTSKTDNTTANRSFERSVYAVSIAKQSVIAQSASHAVNEKIRTKWAKKDFDGDGVPDYRDKFPKDSTETEDTDGDGKGDNSDAFPNDSTEQDDNDNDGVGDNSDEDDDNDGVPDTEDAFPKDSTEQEDNDNDGVGDNRDEDDDNDGVPDTEDQAPKDANATKDTDGDGVGDSKDAFINDPNESEFNTVIEFDQNIAFQTVAVNTNSPLGVEYRYLHLSTNDGARAGTVVTKDRPDGSKQVIVQYVQATTGKQNAAIGKNLRALFPGDWLQYLYEPIKTWNGPGNNILSQDFTTFYDIIQFQQTYNELAPHQWIKYVANDTERSADPALGGAQSTDGPNIYFNVVIVDNVDRLPGGNSSGVYDADQIRYYRNQRTPSWYSVRSHHPVIHNRGVVGYGLSVMAQGRTFSTPVPLGMQYAPTQEVSSGSATMHPNGYRVIPAGSVEGNMPNDLYDYIYYRAYLNRISTYNVNTSDKALNATEAQTLAKAYADTWVRWVEATDNSSFSHVSIGRDGQNYYYRGGYYEFKAADPANTTISGSTVIVKGVKWFDARLYSPALEKGYYIDSSGDSWKDSSNLRAVVMFDQDNQAEANKFMTIAKQRVFGINTEPIVKDVDGKDVTGKGVMTGSPYYYTTTPQ